jgi:hypothetical protein
MLNFELAGEEGRVAARERGEGGDEWKAMSDE